MKCVVPFSQFVYLIAQIIHFSFRNPTEPSQNEMCIKERNESMHLKTICSSPVPLLKMKGLQEFEWKGLRPQRVRFCIGIVYRYETLNLFQGSTGGVGVNPTLFAYPHDTG